MAKMKITLISVARSISEETGISPYIVKNILTEMLRLTKVSVVNDQHVILRGFGTFYKKRRNGRKYYDMRSGQVKKSKPYCVPAFRPSKVLLQRMPNVIRRSPQKSSLTTLHPREILNGDFRNDCKIIISERNPMQTDNLRINYIPSSLFDSKEIYPIIHTPSPDSYLKLPRFGRSDIYGYKEQEFYEAIKKEFPDISVSNNFHVKVPGRCSPYEPDIVLYDENLNLYIDVEIDEPYDGYSRLTTHTIEGRDAIRDLFFKESGWVVIRFTEKQVHLSQELCLNTIRNILDALRGHKLQNLLSLETESRWTRNQAVSWEKELYREKYLGVTFFQKQRRTQKVQCVDGEEGIDAAIKRTPLYAKDMIHVNDADKGSHPTVYQVDLPLSKTHPPMLKFAEETHSYSTPGDLTGNTDRMSVTTLIENFFPYFDVDAYVQKRMEETKLTEEDIRKELAEPSERGTDMHKQIENFLKGEPYDSSTIELQHFLKFYNEQILNRGLTFDSAEYAIELKDSNIAGTVDALFKKPNGEYVIVDWKRSKHLIIDGYPKKYGFGRGLSVLAHLDNSSYYKYEVQQSFYKYILEKDYGIKVSSMILVVLYPDYDRYYTIKLSEYRKQEVMDMIESYEQLR